MKTYTRRERVATALNHQEPDRCPCDLTVSPPAYDELCKFLGISYDPLWWDDFNHAFPSVECLEKLDVDVMHIPAYCFVARDFDMNADRVTTQWGLERMKIKDSPNSFMYEYAGHPLAGISSVEEVYAYPWPKAEDLYDPSKAEELVRHLYHETDFALTLVTGGWLFEMGQFLMGFENYLIALQSEPEIAQAIMDKTSEIQMQLETLVLQSIGKYLTYIRLNGEDMGTQNAPLINPAYYRQVVKPRHAREWNHVKQEFRKVNPDGKLCIHSCGSVYSLIPDMLEAGMEMLNPVQPNAAMMDTAVLGREFGDRLCFHGAIDSQRLLVSGTPEEIRQDVKQKIRDLGTGGGYICAPSHNLQYGVPGENVLALYDAIHEYGKYPLI
jgi:uroporphyrinogen decarboxylase